MKKTITFFVSVSICYAAFAQVNADSLFTIWNDTDQPDTARLQAMDELTLNYYFRTKGDLDSSFFYCEQLIDTARAKASIRYEAIGLHNMASVELYRGNIDRSLELNQQSLALRKEIQDIRGIGRSLGNIGKIYGGLHNSKLALDYLNDALVHFEQVDDKALISFALNSIAAIYSTNGQYEQAIEIMSRSLTIIEDSGDVFMEIRTEITMANHYIQLQEYDKTKAYAELAIEKAKNNNFLAQELQGLLLLGNMLSTEGNHQEALQICEQVLSRTKAGEHGGSRNYAYTLMGWTYQEMGDYDNALLYYKEGIKIGRALNHPNVEYTNAIELGVVYQLKKDGKNGVKWCGEALALGEAAGSIKNQAEACKCLYESYKLLNNGTKALRYHERYLTLQDSLQIKEAGKKLQALEFQKMMLQDSIAKADEARLVQETHEHELRQKNRMRNLLGGGGLVLLLLAGGIYSRLRYVRKSKAKLQVEKDRSENLLLNILPAEIAEELKEKGKAQARDFDMVSILFSDFKGFTEQSAKLSAADLVNEINYCFEAFDGIMEKYGIEKIKTIGDAYMAAGGLPVPTDDSTKNTVLAALEMQTLITQRKKINDELGKPAFEMRVGIHTGPVVAGIVGVKKFQYDIWGDTVNTANRIESNGEVAKVNISRSTYELLKDDPQFSFKSRGSKDVKGKGAIEMWFVSLRSDKK